VKGYIVKFQAKREGRMISKQFAEKRGTREKEKTREVSRGGHFRPGDEEKKGGIAKRNQQRVVKKRGKNLS